MNLFARPTTTTGLIVRRGSIFLFYCHRRRCHESDAITERINPKWGGRTTNIFFTPPLILSDHSWLISTFSVQKKQQQQHKNNEQNANSTRYWVGRLGLLIFLKCNFINEYYKCGCVLSISAALLVSGRDRRRRRRCSNRHANGTTNENRQSASQTDRRDYLPILDNQDTMMFSQIKRSRNAVFAGVTGVKCRVTIVIIQTQSHHLTITQS